MPANDRQIGGEHYLSEYQPWDFIMQHNIGYLEACIIKYVTRHRSKGGREDLEKALHYADKAIDSAENYTFPMLVPYALSILYRVSKEAVDAYCKANNLTDKEKAVITIFSCWDGTDEFKEGRKALLELIAEAYP